MSLGPGPAGSPLLEAIALRREALRPSEAKVADAVLANPVRVMDLNIAGLANAAGVSEPTVMRFCAAIGFDGYRAFKIALAQAIALGLPVENSAIRRGDRPAELVEKTFSRTISSLDRARRGLDIGAIERAIDLMAGASDLIFLGLGASGIIAADAVQKFPLFGVPCQGHGDAHLQYVAASLASPASVVVAISETGKTTETVRSAQAAQAAGARVIALTGNDGPLSQVADIEIRTSTFEDTEFYTPTVSRLAALVVVDILATGVALRRPPGALERVGLMRERLSSMREDDGGHGPK